MAKRHLVRTSDGRVGLDMLAVLGEERAEVHLQQFREGDVVIVDTNWSTYVFVKRAGERWAVSTTNPDRQYLLPRGDDTVAIHGCTFGGTMIKIDAIFVGGYLEFFSPGVGIVTTSAVRRVRARQQVEDGDQNEDAGDELRTH